MIESAIVYIRQEVFSNHGAALQTLNYYIYLAENLRRYYNITAIIKSFVEPPLADTAPLAERKELAAALSFLDANPTTSLIVIGLNHLSPQLEERNQIIDLCLRKQIRLLCGQPLIDSARPDSQQELRRNLQKVLR